MLANTYSMAGVGFGSGFWVESICLQKCLFACCIGLVHVALLNLSALCACHVAAILESHLAPKQTLTQSIHGAHFSHSCLQCCSPWVRRLGAKHGNCGYWGQCIVGFSWGKIWHFFKLTKGNWLQTMIVKGLCSLHVRHPPWQELGPSKTWWNRSLSSPVGSKIPGVAWWCTLPISWIWWQRCFTSPG